MFKNIACSVLTLAALLSAPSLRAADEAPVAAELTPAEPVAAMPAAPVREPTRPAATSPRPDDNHVDYRYCLELKTNQEIAACRYKK